MKRQKSTTAFPPRQPLPSSHTVPDIPDGLDPRLLIALKATNLLVFHQDRQLRFTWIANPTLGVTRNEIIGRTDEDILGREAAAPLTAIKRRVLRSGQGERQTVSVKRGELAACYDLVVEPQRDAQGKVIGIICAAHDISREIQLQQSLATYLQDSIEEERRALARDVHDQIGAVLTGVRMRLTTYADHMPCQLPECQDDIREILRQIEHAMESARSIALRLRPPTLDDLGLAETCRWYLRDWEQTTGVRVTGRISRIQPEPDAACGIDLFRMLQELLTNVARHAGATHVKVNLGGGRKHLRLSVADDGRGMANAAPNSGFGLASVRERAARHGGHVAVESGPDGTAVTVTLPGAARP